MFTLSQTHKLIMHLIINEAPVKIHWNKQQPFSLFNYVSTKCMLGSQTELSRHCAKNCYQMFWRLFWLKSDNLHQCRLVPSCSMAEGEEDSQSQTLANAHYKVDKVTKIITGGI